MRLSRRKRASANEPTPVTSSPDDRSSNLDPKAAVPHAPPPETPTPATSLPSAIPGTTDTSPPPSPSGSMSDDGSRFPVVDPPSPGQPFPEHLARTGGPVPAGASPADADLDRFFEALRQVVHDARERLPDEREPVVEGAPADDALSAGDDSAEPAAVGATLDSSTSWNPVGGAMVPAQDAVVPDISSAELAPSTAELVANLEADRDVWRERAIVWRERAIGANVLVKTLNAHLCDLQVNLEDLRMALRILDSGSPPARSVRELPAGADGRDRHLESGAS